MTSETREIPNTSDLLKPDGPVCLVITATLKPVGGTDRFQPAGFPEVGHVIYDAPRTKDGQPTKEKVCIVDSSASMANHLETVCMLDAGSLDLHADLKGLPYVVCQTDGDIQIADGKVASNSDKTTMIASTLTEGHRIASDYFLDARSDKTKDENFRDKLRSEFKVIEVKKDKTYFIPPETWWDIFKTIFKYDPNSLVHGVLFAKEQIKISRFLTSHLEAFGASRVGSSGVKFDRLQKTTSGQPIFSVDEETAERIQATFVLDLGLLRSFGRESNGLNDQQKELLLSLALWKIKKLLLQPFRYRSNCFLKAVELSVSVDGDELTTENPDKGDAAQTDTVKAWLDAVDIAKTLKAAKFDKGTSPTSVFYPADKLFKAGKDDSADDDDAGDED